MLNEHRPIDEAANFITHGVGFLLSLGGSAYLMTLAIKSHHSRVILACGVYCLTLVLLYGASTLSHTFHDLEWRRAFRTLDQACIFLLIAGSFTPFGAIFLTHGHWPLMLWAMWILAFAGVAFVLNRRNLARWAKVPYGVMGWLPAIALWELYQRAPSNLLLWILAGGACYSLGAIFLALDRQVRYFHAVWHILVIAGSVCHYVGVLTFVASG